MGSPLHAMSPGKVTNSKPQFPQGLSFRAGPPAVGQPQLLPGIQASRAALPPTTHSPEGAGQQGTGGELEVLCSAHGRALPSWMPKQGTQRPGASCHSGHIGKACEAAWPGQELACQALAALSPSCFSKTYYVLGTVPGSRAQVRSRPQLPV